MCLAKYGFVIKSTSPKYNCFQMKKQNEINKYK